MIQPQLEEVKNLCLCKNCVEKMNGYVNCAAAKALYQICLDHSGPTPDTHFKLLIRSCPRFQSLYEMREVV